jgi:hypothetical protein
MSAIPFRPQFVQQPEDIHFEAREEIKQKFPGLAKRADLGHPLPSIRLFCEHCMGDAGTPADCADKGCFLWPLRMGHRPQPIAISEGEVQQKGVA